MSGKFRVTQIRDSINWNVNSSFSIDPEFVANSEQQLFGEYDHLIWYSQNLWWFFFPYYPGSGNTYYLNYSTSSNGIQWIDHGAFASYAELSGNEPEYDVAVSRNTIYYVEDNEYNTNFAWRGGTLQSGGSIQWFGAQSSTSLRYPTSFVFPSISFDKLGRPWFVIPEQSTITQGKLMVCPCYSDVFVYSNGIMQNSNRFSDAGASGSIYMPSSQILGLANGEMTLVTCEQCNGSPQTVSGAYIAAADTSGQGSSWGSLVSLTSSTNNQPVSFAADSFGSTVFVAYYDVKTDSAEAASLNYGSSSANPIASILSTSDTIGLTMTKDAYGNLAITIADSQTNTVTSYKSTNGGASWPLFEKLSLSADLYYANTVAQTLSTSASGLSGIGWEEGNSEPKQIEFASFPIVVPNPSVISNSWSRPGLSPYESYFSYVDDAISPGNGLLVVKQDDLSLPGRNGLDAVVSRVFATPYSFGPGNYTVGYDNYTLANFGLGWQLNFPWIGNNYLHLPDGQAYQYQWNSSGVFENHDGTDFVMYHWINGTYDLYLADGTRYHFFSNQSLSYESDPTGNNSLTFYYQSDRISSIVDTVGRVISFSYNPLGQVSSISSGSIEWTYGYSGNNLVNVTDPLGRVTQYTYASNNNWLMTNITYPTGAKTNFSYGRDQVGTEDYTYYVVLANAYASPTVLDESNSYSYTASNGIISFCNETTEDGTLGIQSYDIYQFSVPGSGSMYVPITLTNSQSSEVSSGTQVMVNVDWQNYASNLASNLQNVQFLDSYGNPIYAWCESSCGNTSASSIVWLKLDQPIPASGTLTVYLSINMNTSTNNLGPAGYWGEYPTATSTYGQYDNGAKVFNNYWNFAGTSLPTGWNNAGSSYSINNGITIKSTNDWEGIYYGMPIGNNIVADALASPNTQQAYGIAFSTVVPNAGGGEPTQNGYVYEVNGWGTGGADIVKDNNGYTFLAGGNNQQYPVLIGTSYVFSGFWGGSSLINSADYAKLQSASDSTYSSASYLYIGSWGSGSGDSWTTHWLRTRTPPPNNVMPWATFGISQGGASSHTVEDASHSQLRSSTSISDFLGRNIETQTFGSPNSLLYTTSSTYDNWGNLITSIDAIGHETWYSYANANSYNTFSGSGSDFSNSFYTNNSIISQNIHDALVGEAQLQNGPGSAAMETYFNYNAAGELLHKKELHVPNGNLGFLENVGGGGSAGPTSTLTVNSIAENGTQISGYYTILFQNGNAIATGFTPVTFTLNDNQQYAVQVQDYGGYAFDYWADTGNATQTRSISINSNTALLAVYKPTGGSTPPSGDSVISVNTMLANGTIITGYYTTLWQNGQVIASGFSPVNFTVTCCATYAVLVSNYGDYVFSSWGDGNASAMRDVTPLNQGTLILTAVYADRWLVSSFTYDQYGNQLTATDSLGRTTYYQYSSAYDHAYMTQQSMIVSGQNVSTTYTYNFTLGLENSVTNPNGGTTYYSFDNLGRLTVTVYPMVNGVIATKQYSYDDKNNILTSIDENGNIVKQYYDGLGRVTEVQRYNGTSVYSTETYTYNYQNQVYTDTIPSGGMYTYYYDALGRQIQVINPDHTSSTTLYAASGSLNTKSVTDANGHETEYGYNWANDLIWVREYYTSTSYYKTTYSYDQVGNLLSMTDANNNVTSYQYDDLSRLVLTTNPDGTSLASTYDSVGNLLAKTDAMGNVITYSYDSLNRLIGVTYPNESSVAYTYDGDGNRLSMVGAGSSTYYTYDARDRLTNQTSVISSTSYSVLYSYDKANNIIMLTYPNGYKLNYTYDALERVSNVGSFATISYTVDDKISTITYGNGVKTSYSYDSRDRPTQIESMLGSAKLMDLSYSYDAAGNVLSINNENFTYDWINRVSSAVGPWGTINYTYDGSGNMLSLINNGVTTSYAYAANNKLESAGSVSLAYNSNGDLVKQVNGSTTFTYSYDYENRLTAVAKNGASLENNTYNPDGQRIERVQGSSSTYYFYEGSAMIASASGSSWMNSFYADGMLLAQVSGISSYYYQNDALGSTRLVTASTGAILFSSDYEPFGTSFNPSGSFIPDYQYTGKIVDYSSTDLYYYGARFYDPSLDRFITEDTSKGSLEDPLSLNRYAYARDNPEAITDPTGHGWWSSLTSAVSNTVSSTVNTVTSAATSVESNIVSAASNPENQAIALTVGLDVGTAIAVAATDGTILATPQGQALLGAAISTTSYTITEGGKATLTGAVESAGIGGLSGLAGAGIGNVFGDTAGSVLKVVAGHLLSGAVGAGTTFVEDRITGQRVNYGQMAVDAGISAMSFGLTIHPNIIGDVREYPNLVAEDEFPSSIASSRVLNYYYVSAGFGVGGGVADYLISRYIR